MKTAAGICMVALLLGGCAPLGPSQYEREQAERDRQRINHPLHYERLEDLPASMQVIQAMEPPGSGNHFFANGRGQAFNSQGERIPLRPEEPVEVLSINPDNGLVLVSRKDFNTLANVTREGLEVGRYN